ncbi:MAG: glycosyltransferase, partial [Acidobacteriota bacterium]
MAPARARGGLLRVVETLARLQARSHEVLVLSPAPLAGLAPPHWTEQQLDGNTHLFEHFKLARRLAAFRPDLVVLHAGSPGECALAAALLSVHHVVIVVEHAPDHYPRAGPWRDRVFAAAKRR